MKVRIGNGGDEHEDHKLEVGEQPQGQTEHHEQAHDSEATDDIGEATDPSENPAGPESDSNTAVTPPENPASMPETPEPTPPADAEKPRPELVPVVLSSGAIAFGKTIEIECVDCGTKRLIKPQDVFQVKRCLDCQTKFRNKARGEARKAKRAKEREQQQAEGKVAATTETTE